MPPDLRRRRPRIARILCGIAPALALAFGVFGTSTPDAAPGAPACWVPSVLPSPPAARARYALGFRLNPGLTEAIGSLRVSFRPTMATDRLVFRLWPNSPFYWRRGTRLTVSAVTAVGKKVATIRPNATTLVVHRAVRAGEEATVAMNWRLRLPRGAGLTLRGGGGSARLASFFPLLAWDGSGWATEPGMQRQDSFWPTSPTAEFDVRITAPRGVRVFASGEPLGEGRWRARSVRDFAVAIGDFTTKQTTVRLPRPVRVRVAVERRSGSSIQPFLTETVRALRWYARRYGPYPWPTYTLVAMSDYPSLAGTAYPTLGFLGDSSLVLVPHETAHQWFASLVGNNQARDPWLSEGLATWAQAGPEQSLATLIATAVPADVRNRLGEPMSFWDARDFEKIRLGVYVQGVQALASLGDAATVECALRLFVVRNAYRTATPRDLLAALVQFVPDAETKLTAYGARF